MNKAELAAEVAERLHGVEPDARQYVDTVFDVIMRRVAAGERVQILGFGTFDSVGRAARVGRNPRTGEAIQVPAGVSPRFHAGQKFRAQVTDASPVPAVVANAEAPAPAVAATGKGVAKPAKVKKAKTADKKPGKAAKAAVKTRPAKVGKAAKATGKGNKAGKK